MLSWIRSLFRNGKQVSEPALPTVTELATRLRDLESLATTISAEDFGARTEAWLSLVKDKLEQVEYDASDYPIIRADVWMDGAGIAAVAERAAHLLRERGMPVLEGKAHGLRVRATYAVQRHYDHLMSRAMLAGADCAERVGDTDFARKIYESTIKSLTRIVETYELEGDAPSDEDRLSLQSLNEAIARARALQSSIGGLESLAGRVDALLKDAPTSI